MHGEVNRRTGGVKRCTSGVEDIRAEQTDRWGERMAYGGWGVSGHMGE
jgi:hypothetical protein